MFEAYLQLPQPTTKATYAVESGSGWCRVGRSSEGFAVLVLRFERESPSREGRALSLITYQPPAAIEVVGQGSTDERAAILECKTSDQALVEYFFRIVRALIVDSPTTRDENEFMRALDRVIALFRALSKPGRSSAQGLWAELAMLVWAPVPHDAILAWHSNPRELFDFSTGATRLDVKSTAKPVREHEFLLDQLNTEDSGHTLIASLMLETSDHGPSISDLVESIRLRTPGMQPLHAHVVAIVTESIGQGWREAGEVRFDLASARENLRVFEAGQIPSVSKTLPFGVSHVRFTSKLDGAEALSLVQAREIAPLYAALLPVPVPGVTPHD